MRKRALLAMALTRAEQGCGAARCATRPRLAGEGKGGAGRAAEGELGGTVGGGKTGGGVGHAGTAVVAAVVVTTLDAWPRVPGSAGSFSSECSPLGFEGWSCSTKRVQDMKTTKTITKRLTLILITIGTPSK